MRRLRGWEVEDRANRNPLLRENKNNYPIAQSRKNTQRKNRWALCLPLPTIAMQPTPGSNPLSRSHNPFNKKQDPKRDRYLKNSQVFDLIWSMVMMTGLSMSKIQSTRNHLRRQSRIRKRLNYRVWTNNFLMSVPSISPFWMRKSSGISFRRTMQIGKEVLRWCWLSSGTLETDKILSGHVFTSLRTSSTIR